ncbi:MAG: adenine phosphoribosyltransferase [Tepidiforma sp.]|nr:MAG: adenine phosphoribosyltransferase [Tepidiforma sp.]
MELARFIRSIPDFPRPGILFRDITPLLGDPGAFRSALDALTALARDSGAGAIVGIESRGFLFGAPIADRLGLPFVPVRKEGKLPAARLTVEYALEYGESRLDIHQDALAPGTAAYIVDDVLATGGTALATAKLVELLGARVCGMGFLIELAGLGGRERLGAYAVEAVLRFEEA